MVYIVRSSLSWTVVVLSGVNVVCSDMDWMGTMETYSKTKHAFTLIELLVVISVIGVLMAILMPALGKARKAAQRVTCAAHQRGFGLAF